MTNVSNPDASAAAQPRAGGLKFSQAVTVFCAGLGVRLWLVHVFPVIFGGDSIVRLANQDRILLSYQLPLLQAIIHGLSTLSNDPLAVRYFMAFAGALAGLAFYAMACSLLGRRAGFQSALLFTSSPFVIAFSIVPYQEILMLAGLFASFYFAFERKWIAAGVTLGLACLTRYEAWLACPVLAIAFLIEKGFRPLEIARAALLFGWAPLSWMAFHGGVTPQGTYAAEAAFSLERFFRYVYLAWITVKNTPPPVLLLAFFGGWLFWKRRLIADRRYRLLGCFLLLFLAAILLSAHGERDQPERFVTAREAHVLLAAVVLAAGAGLARFDSRQAEAEVRAGAEGRAEGRAEAEAEDKAKGKVQKAKEKREEADGGEEGAEDETNGTGLGALIRPWYGWVFVLAGCVAGLWMAYGFVANETSQPPFALSYEVARYLDEHVQTGESAVVLAQPVPSDLLRRYLDKAAQSAGRAGRDEALAVLLDMDTSPPNYQRILVHSRLTKQQLRSVSSLPADLVPSHEPLLPSPDWLVLWSDFLPTNEAEQNLGQATTGLEPKQTFERDGLRVAIYRLRQVILSPGRGDPN
ncbi:MAG: glycosyltransferase family 39 protein [Bryobacterales bacterium]